MKAIAPHVPKTITKNVREVGCLGPLEISDKVLMTVPVELGSLSVKV
jgi:hypothetical protein